MIRHESEDESRMVDNRYARALTYYLKAYRRKACIHNSDDYIYGCAGVERIINWDPMQLTRDRIGGIRGLHLCRSTVTGLLIMDVCRKGSEDADGLVNKCGSRDQHAGERRKYFTVAFGINVNVLMQMNPDCMISALK